MIRDRLIVCIASAWDYDPTCKHHLMRILSRENEVLWINYHGSRRPEVNRADLRDGCAALRRIARGRQRISESIVQLTPLVIPGARHPWVQAVHRRLLVVQIRSAVRALSRERRRPVQVWSFAPDVPYLIGTLEEECFLYYCTDEYRHFENFDGEGIARAEDEMLRRADVVIATSEGLLCSKGRVRPNAVLVRHGVDLDHFASAWRSPPPCPADLSRIPRPIFGYFGLIHHWVDRALLAEVARRRPGYSFVLIGDCKVDVSDLRRLPNVHLLGRRPYADLPAYSAAFDAAMMLFRPNAMTRMVNPIKMYEYLAAGLPVVSTPLPEAERFRGAIRFGEDAAGFSAACDDALRPGVPDRPTLSRLVESETWDSKVRRISGIIRTATDPEIRTASRSGVSMQPTLDASTDWAAALR